MAAFGRTQLLKLAQMSSMSLNGAGSATRTMGAGQLGLGDSQKRFKSKTSRLAKILPKAKYGGRHTVTMLPGGGIGPELMGYVREVFRYAGVPVDFEEVNINPNTEGNEDLEYAITSIRRNGVALKGNIETKSLSPNVMSRNVALRNELDLFVNVIHCLSYAGVPSRQKDIDVYLIRQNTEGEYAMLEHESVYGVVECLKIVTRENSERLARYAFDFAKKHGRKKVTTIHKANIMKTSDGLFLEISRQIAKEYPDIQHNDMIIDNCCMQLVSNPHQFDVMLMTNLYGSIVSNVICGLMGGAGLLSGRNYGTEYAIFEPGTRNTGTSIAGKNIANPISMMNAAADLLHHLRLENHSVWLREAIDQTINVDKIHTPDLGGQATSMDVVKNIVNYLQAKTKASIVR
ncbi:isocitrate dehydrogenase [NAD] subunit gamma, mitochondrial isoform X2 [Folsomia candida]|uniref:isocitrate dehydrogenase [NAD] subunit gamma, mitochondrial isoform X2 n=1 Tax=Folsomia candida TaxID=158441 RepID=UPI000B8FB40C|nr:isocitrate dehydrogenase [NAD] subunit gamma, mitochondrial isoform X2 [Folsomia candida]